MRLLRSYLLASLLVVAGSATSPSAQTSAAAGPNDVKPGSINCEDVAYPYPVSYLPLTLYGQDVRMAYMDVPPAGAANGRQIVLLHGMNFGGFYFGGLIESLRKEGFRVVVPDQIGFGRSSKPVMPYNFHDMAANTRRLIESLGVVKPVIFGHSMGGMLAARFSASYPDFVERAVLCNAIGLVDVRWKSPWLGAEEAYKATMAQSRDQLYKGFQETIQRYFPNAWKPEYEKFVRIMYAPTLSADWPRLAMVRAIYRQMPYLDPVVYDWAHIQARTLVIGGDKDGENFPALAKQVADTIPHGELVLIPNVGHVPHIQVPDVFSRELLKFLA